MSKITQINNMLATAAGLTKQQTETMADGDWLALRHRARNPNPPDADLRMCLEFARRDGAAQLVAYYQMGVQQEKKNRLRRELAESRSDNRMFNFREAMEDVRNDRDNLFAKKMEEASRKISAACRLLPDMGIAAAAGGMAPSPMLKAAAEAEEKWVKAEYQAKLPIVTATPKGPNSRRLAVNVEVPDPTFECPECRSSGPTPCSPSCSSRCDG